ncbi:hypothetical protein Gotri_011142, partial [Gossypium trilobum]|nr:hypothetical protein [Gossypium trilobum]
GKEEDVRLGANKFLERQPIETAAQTQDDRKAYTETETNRCSTVGFEGIAWAFGGTIFVLVYYSSGILVLVRLKGFMGNTFDLYGGEVNFVSPSYTKGDGLGFKIMGTFILVYTVLSATDGKRSARDSHIPILAPLSIRFAVLLVHLATLTIIAAGINPTQVVLLQHCCTTWSMLGKTK